MPKVKKKLTPAQKRAKAERRKMYQTVFTNGKQVRIKRPPMVEGVPVDEFIANNADPIWLHQHEMWELIPYEDSDLRRDRPDGPESEGSVYTVNESPCRQTADIEKGGFLVIAQHC